VSRPRKGSRHDASQLVGKPIVMRQDDNRHGNRDWVVIPRIVVWLLFMASGVVVIPLSIVMWFAYFPGGLPVLLGWLDWAEGIHSWMLGRTSFLGTPLEPPSHSTRALDEEVEHCGGSRVCPVCDYECVTESGTVNQCPNCTHLFDIDRVQVATIR